MMSDEIMVSVDPKCIPFGWEAVRIGFAEKGEVIE
jgi:hypothetical protein